MKGYKTKQTYFKFFLYFLVIILINIVGITLFFRIDLTKNRLYSLSDASYEVVETLSEPLTVKIFFTKNLPAPYNNTERYLHDLMEEYAGPSKFFNYEFYDVTADKGELTSTTNQNRQIAEDYGISPVEIRIIENDEIKFQQAYMGLVIIHGDMIEKIPSITSTNGLEYQLTISIQKLNKKISALLALKDKVKITMYFSSSLKDVAPFIGLNQISDMPEIVRNIIKKLNFKNFNKIDFKYINPIEKSMINDFKKYNIMVLTWPEILQQNLKAGAGGAGIVMEYKNKIKTISLITSINIPIIGTSYQMTNPIDLENILSNTMENMVGINQDIGYLADHGTLFMDTGGMQMIQSQQKGYMNVFNQLISKRYTVKDINLKENNIPESIKSLIIARPTEKFSDYELFLIDQALMKGTNLAIFLDAFNEIMPSQQAAAYGMKPEYKPIDTGLLKLLKHYGVEVNKSYVMDVNCYKQMVPGVKKGGETKIYFAPMIKDVNINNKPFFMKNIKGLIAMQISPLKLNEKIIKANKINASMLFSSSKKSWEIKDKIDLNPRYIKPPNDKDMKSYPLSYMLTGEFISYFADKTLPEKDMVEKTIKNMEDKKTNLNFSKFKMENNFVKKGEKAKIFVMACSQMLQDNMLDPQGRTTNATFILNVIDHLNNQDKIAEMRSKNQTLNPLMQTDSFARVIIKFFNIVIVPVFVIFCGILVWLKRRTRKKHIKKIFYKEMEDKKE